jgi:hypothetical protein
LGLLSDALLAMDMLLRLFGCYLILMSFSMTAALPCILFQPVDAFLVRRGWLVPSHQVTVVVKIILGHLILLVSGIALVVEEEVLMHKDERDLGIPCVTTRVFNRNEVDDCRLDFESVWKASIQRIIPFCLASDSMLIDIMAINK